jgi:hypothetical protein
MRTALEEMPHITTCGCGISVHAAAHPAPAQTPIIVRAQINWFADREAENHW